jgi:putative sterol carrier protein
MTYKQIFGDVKKSLMKADVSNIAREFAIQCNIQGEGEGSFYIAFKDGIFSVEPYDYNDRDAQLFASGETFMQMFAKKIDGMKAFELGLLGFDGDVDAVLTLGGLQPKKAAAVKKAAPAAKKPTAKKPAAKKAESKPAAKGKPKSDAKPEAKAEPKSETKPEAK